MLPPSSEYKEEREVGEEREGSLKRFVLMFPPTEYHMLEETILFRHHRKNLNGN
jgi:hypothetical protein